MTDYVTLLALCDKQKEEIQALKAKVAELENTLAKCERVIRVPNNTNTACDFNSGV